MNIFKTCAMSILLTGGILPAYADIIIKSKMDSIATPDIEIKSRFEEFKEDFSLKLESKPDMTAHDVFMRKALSYDITDTNGNSMQKEGLDFDKKNDVIMGFSDGSTEIISTKKRDDGGLEVTGSFKKNGAFYTPRNNQLAVHNLSTGEKLCTHKTEADKKQAIVVLMDTSGSMVNVLDDVKQSTSTFLNALPDQSVCAVATFKFGFKYGHKHYQACNDGNFGYDDAVASGDTDIFFVLADAYKTLAGDYFKDHQKAVVIITDGYTLDDEKRKQELLKLKGNTLTFVSFLGGEHRDQLEGITDSFLPQDKNIKDGLKKYFSVLSDAYNTQKTVIAHKCTAGNNGGSHANP